jgi:hypothetical protein
MRMTAGFGQRSSDMARIRSAILNILRINGIQDVSRVLYVNAFDRMPALCSSSWN